MDKKLSGRWAIVTGASSGIGLEFSKHLAQMGLNVLMISNQPDQLTQCANQIHEANNVQTRALAIDLTDKSAIDEVCEAVGQLPECPLVLINNAGIFDFKEVAKMTPKRLDLYIDLHMRAVTQLCRSIGQLMAEHGQGYILNMSSMSCWMPMPGIAMYSATKAYIRVFSRAFRIEMLDRGVKVMVACPGGIATDLFGLPPRLQRLGVAVGALATPGSFARRAIKRLMRGKAQYINGLFNRMTILFVGVSPQWMRKLVKTKLLNAFGNE